MIFRKLMRFLYFIFSKRYVYLKVCLLLVSIITITFLFISNDSKIVTKNDLTPNNGLKSVSKLKAFQINKNQLNEQKVSSNETNDSNNESKTIFTSNLNNDEINSEEDNETLRIRNNSSIIR